jgi:Ala-tRNA(Pro) deacylase
METPMPVRKLKRFLDENEVEFVAVSHSRAFTAQEIAASAHVPGKELAKTVMVRLDGSMAMAVVPAPCQVDLESLREVSGAGAAELALESEFQELFPACEVGAMPPFGNLWDLDVYVDEELREDEEIAFNAGSHTELIRLGYDDFERLVRPTVAEITVERSSAFRTELHEAG